MASVAIDFLIFVGGAAPQIVSDCLGGLLDPPARLGPLRTFQRGRDFGDIVFHVVGGILLIIGGIAAIGGGVAISLVEVVGSSTCGVILHGVLVLLTRSSARAPRRAGQHEHHKTAMVKISAVEHSGPAAIELVERRTRVVVVHAIGPRIACFGLLDHDNLLFWDVAKEHTRGDWRLYGGHRLWTTRPGADESEEAYSPDNSPCRVRELGGGIAVVAPPDRSQIEKTLVVRADGPDWIIEHRIRNTGDMLWSGGAWGLTCTAPRRGTRGTRYHIPVDGGDPRWDLFTMVVPRRWGGEFTKRVAPLYRLRARRGRSRPVRSRIACRKLLTPAPRAIDDAVQLGQPWLPTELAPDLCRVRDQTGRRRPDAEAQRSRGWGAL